MDYPYCYQFNLNSGQNLSYDEFVQICVEGCANRDLGLDLAKVLDDFGSVIVLGVFFSMYESGSSIKGVYFLFGKIIDYLAVNQGMFMCSFFFLFDFAFIPSIDFLVFGNFRSKMERNFSETE
ncbi:putative MCU family protein [Helianthus annuus]|nr:putative MCU family protein [Helianthus annuus]KAJ0486195.1 putative MCU family protein [Helianthus annuus]KAJ0656744.1 putative MCU family protein [Helianthus annuus]KAJ0660345.1 putative MCU family protein [Helianthus annuus]